MLPMHPHRALSQALIAEFNGERTRTVRTPRRSSRLRAVRSRRAARTAAACA